MESWTEYRGHPSWIRRIVVLAALVLAGWGGYRVFGPDRAAQGVLAEAVADLVEEAMEDGPISGVSVVISRGARVIHASGYGYADIENELPITPETVFHLGSITKQFTAATVIQQVEEGRIDLDATVTDYLPDFTEYAHITVEQLLNHTSGIRDYTAIESSWEVLGLDMIPLRVTDYFRREPLDFASGTRFSYTNSGYVLLGLILEAVTERPYGGLLNEEIFVPMSLSASAYCDDRRLVPNRAQGYEVTEEGFVHSRYLSMSQVFSAGAICGSAMDLARWIRTLARGAIVGRRGYERMTTPGQLADGSRIEYGYGLSVGYFEGHHRVGHVGGILGFMGQVSHYADDNLTIVVLTNTEGSKAAQLESAIARFVLELEDEVIRDLVVPDEQLAKYVGAYDIGPTVVEVGIAEGRLYADVNLPRVSGRFVFLNQGEETFRAQDDPQMVVTFELTDDGSVTGFVLRQRGITTHAQRVGPS